MVMMPELPEVTDPAEREKLARWAVSLRRAFAAQIGQTTGKLHARVRVADVAWLADGALPGTAEATEDSYCCLGVWCAVQAAAGVLQARTIRGTGVVEYADTDPGIPETVKEWAEGALPAAVYLNGLDDPDLLKLIRPEDWDRSGGETLEDIAQETGYRHEDGTGDVDSFVDHEAITVSAAGLNDDYGLTFAQIADVIVWRYGLTPEELAIAEAAPRVPEVEGPAS